MHKDPFGQAMLDYIATGEKIVIRVDSNITEDEEMPLDYLFRKSVDFPEKEHMALQLAKGKTLDAGAGSGCHSLYLQEKGVDVTALDFSELCVKAMKLQGLEKVVHADFFEYEEEKFDTILFLMNGLGMPGTIDRMDVFFQKCKQLLKPGGQIIGESTDIIYMFQDEDGSVVLDLNAGYHGEMEYQMTHGDIVSDWFKWLYVGLEIVQDTADRNGFNLEVIYRGEENDYVVKMTVKEEV